MNLIAILKLSFYAFLFLWSIGSLVAVFHLLKYGMSRVFVGGVLMVYFAVSFTVIGGVLYYFNFQNSELLIQYDLDR